MEIAKGFQLEQPRVFVGWGITRDELEGLFAGTDLKQVDGFYFYLAGCVSLGDLSRGIEFRFSRRSERLYEIGFRVHADSIEESFPKLQQHLEATFGAPTMTSAGEEGFPDHIWLVHGVRIEHNVHEHFGPAERAAMTKTD